MKEFKLREINMDNLYHITISNNKAIENAINELRQEVEELKLQLSRIKKDKHENIDNRDAIIEKQREIIKKQEITISYFLKYSGESERISRFMNEIKTTRSELSALEAPPKRCEIAKVLNLKINYMESLSEKQITRGKEWYELHKKHVDSMLFDEWFIFPYPPSGEDKTNPALWKQQHWLWFKQNFITDTKTKEIRTARKAHVCNWCGCTIPVGEQYMTGVFKYDGVIYSWKNHKRCDELVSKLNMEGEEGVTGEDFYEYITEEFRTIWNKLDPDLFDSKDFVIPSFKEQVEFVYSQRCQKSSVTDGR